MTEFKGHKTSSDGLQSWCRECSNDYTALAEKWKDIGGVKCCRLCHENKPKNRDYFSPDPARKDGLKTICKECESKLILEWNRQLKLELPDEQTKAEERVDLSLFTSRELIDELKKRGYTGELKLIVTEKI